MGNVYKTDLEIITIESEEDFFALEKDWNRLLGESGSDNIFLTFEWLTCWWKVFKKNKKLFILLVKEADEIIGIAPFMISKARKFFIEFGIITFIGMKSSAYGDLIIKRNRSEVLRAILKFLVDKTTLWDVIVLKQIPEDSPNLSFLKEFEGNSKFLWEKRNATPCFYIPLKDGWESYFANFSSRERKNFRLHAKKLNEIGEVRFIHYGNNGDEDVSKIIPTIIEIFNKRWEAKKKVSPLLLPEKREFIEEVAKCFQKKNWLDLVILKCNGQIVAYILGFCYNRKYWSWNTAFDPDFSKFGPGALILKEVIEYAFKKNLSEFDILQGKHPYKTKMARGERKTFEILIFKKGLFAYIFYLWTVKLRPWLKRLHILKRAKERIEHLRYYIRRLVTINDNLRFLKRARAVYQNRGITGVLKGVLKRIGFRLLRYEQFYFYELSLRDDSELLPPELAKIFELVTKRYQYEIKWITKKSTENLQLYLAYRKDISRRQVVRSLQREHTIVMALDRGKIIGDCWLALDSFPILPGCAKIADMFQQRGYAYSFRAYVEPQYRGRGIMPLLICEQMKAIRRYGITALLGVAKLSNISSILSLEKMGWRRIYTLRLFYLLGIKLYQNGKDKA